MNRRKDNKNIQFFYFLFPSVKYFRDSEPHPHSHLAPPHPTPPSHPHVSPGPSNLRGHKFFTQAKFTRLIRMSSKMLMIS